jgi:hypothetical protein
MALVLFAFFSKCSFTRAAPLPQASVPKIQDVFYNPSLLRNESEIAPSWMPNPKGRGTLDILWSCLFTLSLCVYTAIHLNVPPPGSGRIGFLWQKTKWVVVGILAPELVVYTAFKQLQLAKDIRDRLNEMKEKKGNDVCIESSVCICFY